MILLVGHYDEPVPERAAEYAECLQRNCKLQCIEQVHRFIETATWQAFDHPKVKDIHHGRRLRFDELFDYATRELAGHICIIANSDIFFDESLQQLAKYDFTNKLLAIARWNVQADGSVAQLNEWCPQTQDTWIFRAPLRPFRCDWHLGLMQCDRRIVYEARQAGIEVRNPCFTIKTYHLHLTDIHHYSPETEVKGPIDFAGGEELSGKMIVPPAISPSHHEHSPLPPTALRSYLENFRTASRRIGSKPLSYYESARPELVECIDVQGKKVLDLGCGAGCMGEALLAKGASEVIGIDILAEIVALARARLTDAFVYDLETLPRLPFADGHFDVLVCADVLEHLKDPQRALQHFLRWLASDGKLLCSVPNVRHESVLLPLLRDGTWKYQESGILDYTHLRFFTFAGIHDLINSIGFVCTSIGSIKSEPSVHIEKLCAAVHLTGGCSDHFLSEAIAVQYFVTARRVSQ